MSLVNGNEQIRGESHAQLLMRLMKELLRDEQEHSLMEMKQTIMQQTGEEYSHGTWAGAVRTDRDLERLSGCPAGSLPISPACRLARGGRYCRPTEKRGGGRAAAGAGTADQAGGPGQHCGGGGVGAENGSLPAGNLPASPGGNFPVRRAGMS